MYVNRIAKVIVPLFIAMQLFLMGVVAPIRAHADDDSGYSGQVIKVVRAIATDNGSGYGTDRDPWPGDQWSNLASGNVFFGILNKNSNTVTYSNLYNANTTTNSAAAVRAQGDAATYGAALDDTGLDHSSASGANNYMFVLIGRALFGALTYLGYGLDVLSYWGYSMVGKLAKHINIFAWISSNPKNDTSGFSFIHAKLYEYYQLISGLEMVIISFMCLAAIGLAILGRKVSKAGREVGTHAGMRHSLYRFLVRVGMMVLVPIAAASIFTGIVNNVATLYNSKSDASVDYAIYSNLFDFGGWVKHSRLQLPTALNNQLKAGVDSDSGSAKAQTPIDHEQILALNQDGAGAVGAKNALDEYKATGGAADTNKQLKAVDATGKDGQGDSTQADSGTSNLIFRWFRYSQYNASDYSSFITAHMPSSYTKNKDGSHSLGNRSTFKSALGGGQGYGGSNDDYFATNGNLKVSDSGYFYTTTPARYGTDIESDKKDGILAIGGISALGMYNYLSSIFDSTSVTWVDSTSLTTIFTSPIHADVGLVGHGMVAIGNLCNMLALLFSLAIINIMFLFFTFTAIIKTVPRLGSYAFMSASLSYGVKLVQGIILFAVEILGGAFLCQLFKDLIISISQFTDSFVHKQMDTSSILLPFSHAKDNVALSGSMGANAYGFLNVMMAILMIYLTLKLIKWRGPILQSVGKIVEDAGNLVMQSFEGTAATPSAHMDKGNMPTVGKDGSNTGGLGSGDDGSNGANGQPGRPGADGGGSNGANGANGANGSNGSNGGGANGANGASGGGYRSLLGRKASGMRHKPEGMRAARRAREEAQGRPMTGSEAMRFYAGRMAKGAGYGAVSKTLGALGEASGIQGLSNLGADVNTFKNSREARANEKAADGSQGAREAMQSGMDREGKTDMEALTQDRVDDNAGNDIAAAVEAADNGEDFSSYFGGAAAGGATGSAGTSGNGETEAEGGTDGGARAAMETKVAASAEEGNKAIKNAEQELSSAKFAAKNMSPSASQEQRNQAQERIVAAKANLASVRIANSRREGHKKMPSRIRTGNHNKHVNVMAPGKTMTVSKAHKGLSSLNRDYMKARHYIQSGETQKAVAIKKSIDAKRQVLIDGGMNPKLVKSTTAVNSMVKNMNKNFVRAANGEALEH